MAIYNLFDLLGPISKIIEDGGVYAEISQLSPDDELPESLEFTSDESDIDSVFSISDNFEDLPSSYMLSEDTPAFVFSLGELNLTLFAVKKALDHLKKIMKDKNNLPDGCTFDELNSTSVRLRNFESKLVRFLRHN